MLQTVTKLTVGFLLDGLLVMFQGRAGLLKKLYSLMFLAFDAQPECLFFVGQIMVGLGRQFFILELIEPFAWRRARRRWSGLYRALPPLLWPQSLGG